VDIVVDSLLMNRCALHAIFFVNPSWCCGWKCTICKWLIMKSQGLPQMCHPVVAGRETSWSLRCLRTHNRKAWYCCIRVQLPIPLGNDPFSFSGGSMFVGLAIKRSWGERRQGLAIKRSWEERRQGLAIKRSRGERRQGYNVFGFKSNNAI
jgi:hypothetical protein